MQPTSAIHQRHTQACSVVRHVEATIGAKYNDRRNLILCAFDNVVRIHAVAKRFRHLFSLLVIDEPFVEYCNHFKDRCQPPKVTNPCVTTVLKGGIGAYENEILARHKLHQREASYLVARNTGQQGGLKPPAMLVASFEIQVRLTVLDDHGELRCGNHQQDDCHTAPTRPSTTAFQEEPLSNQTSNISNPFRMLPLCWNPGGSSAFTSARHLTHSHGVR
jgi:hypothetical protein